jgi:CBS domain-containing protein
MLDPNSDAVDRVRVGDCMRAGFLSCDADASLHQMAATMSAHRVHAVVVRGAHPLRPSSLLTDVDVVGAIALSDQLTAGKIPVEDALTIACSRSVRDAAQLMAEEHASHLVVVDDASGHPVGVISTTDILDAYVAVGADQPET